MKTIRTLLLREWMQHKRGWLVLATLPFVLLLLGVTFGNMPIAGKRDALTPIAGMLGAATFASTLMLMWLAVLLQAPGLARRDVQDRSIEFWLSLPTPAAASVGTTLVTHLVLVPWFALACGMAGAVIIAPLGIVKTFGIAALADVEWGLLAGAGLAIALRIAAGVLLATLWLAPLILGAMVASAWLKRWGLPALVGFIAIGGAVERLLVGTRGIHQAVSYVGSEAALALIGASRTDPGRGLAIDGPDDLGQLLPHAVSWILGDLAAALRNLVHPGFVAVMLLSAALFAALVWRRQRGG
jgi:hypothetical protein